MGILGAGGDSIASNSASGGSCDLGQYFGKWPKELQSVDGEGEYSG